MQRLIDLVRELTVPVGEWAEKNFPMCDSFDPFVGVQEEVGELAHAVLKAKQGIRGTQDQHRADGIDALCDGVIFILDGVYRASSDSETTIDILCDTLEDLSEFAGDGMGLSSHSPSYLSILMAKMSGDIAGCLLDFVDNVAYGQSVPIRRLFRCIAAYLFTSEIVARTLYGVDLADEVRRTWANVQQRDWVSNPESAHLAVAESATEL